MKDATGYDDWYGTEEELRAEFAIPEDVCPECGYFIRTEADHSPDCEQKLTQSGRVRWAKRDAVTNDRKQWVAQGCYMVTDNE